MKDISFTYPPSEKLMREHLTLLKKINTTEFNIRLLQGNESADPSLFEITKFEYPTLLINGIPIHSRHNPIQEAARQLQDIKTESSSQTVIFFGAGLGYSLFLFLHERKNNCIWFESDLIILKAALSILDFREFIDSGRLQIISALPVSKDMQAIFSHLRNKNIVFSVHRPTFKENSDYRKFFQLCENYLNKKDVNLATVTRFERTWASNFIKNLTHLKKGRPVQDLFNRFSDIPALICGAGPSLSDSLDKIKKFRNKFVIIAVDTSLKILRESGIDPHITVTVDPQPINREYIEGYDGNSVFVADLCCSYSLLRNISENKLYYFHSPFALTEIFYECLAQIPEKLAFGGSVSTNAYDLALHMGCKNIYLAGMDLSFTGGRAHARGAVLEEKLNLIESRIFRRELHNYRQLTALPRRYLPSIHGLTAPTNDKLVIFHKWFEGRFSHDRNMGVKIYNASPDGLMISGTELFELKEAVNFIDADADLIMNNISSQTSVSNCNHESLSRSMNNLLDQMEDFNILTMEGVLHAKEIYDAVNEQKMSSVHFQKTLNRLNEIDSELLMKKNVSKILSGIIQKTILIVNDSSEDIDMYKSKKDTIIAKKSLYLYSELTRACKDYILWLKHALKVEAEHP